MDLDEVGGRGRLEKFLEEDEGVEDEEDGTGGRSRPGRIFDLDLGSWERSHCKSMSRHGGEKLICSYLLLLNENKADTQPIIAKSR